MSMLGSALFDGDLGRRYQATVTGEPFELSRKWPVGCGGAANAFLTLIGPSMGGAVPGQEPERGGADRPHRTPMRIGRDAMNLDWGDRRKVRWTRLCSDMLGGDQYVGPMTALLNLDWRHSTSEANVPQGDLVTGLDSFVWPLLEELRPRLVCPLTKRVWKVIRPRVEALSVSHSECPVRLPEAPIIFRLRGCEFMSMLIKPHRHPSRALSYAQISEVGRACRWFLDESK
jgi:hypothetical protein